MMMHTHRRSAASAGRQSFEQILILAPTRRVATSGHLASPWTIGAVPIR